MEQKYLVILPLLLGYLLDLTLGDPRWLPHPIRWFGQWISFGEKRLNKGSLKVLKGACLTILLTGGVFISCYLLIEAVRPYLYVYYPITSILLFFALANKSLVQEGRAVFSALGQDIEAGRKRLSWIVGRETDQLDENKIRLAVFETLSENLSDGVIAPLFYYSIFGVPGALAYKMINTLDSMIGYKSDRYLHFGRFAAKLDDIANFVPARITALLMVGLTMSKRGMIYIVNYGNKHNSPNAGYPEAALAGILNCRFGGPNYYHGKLVQKPFIGTNDRMVAYSEIDKVAMINHMVTLLFVIIIIGIQWVI
ncbi:adenosylcobinamide-phosphate synthase CbiB [Fulvivirga kasyanovii]|uniref:Cobalamin biosynthesis protein CobD n=1 Tax=Fulvivirga kasyanovii TaxID=396812 RepID=A0ABW9RJI5_9BACT|nr:adenosylcobinamide-phosphate synthase CbiB [Fulvivirga kasyanovii]MTI24242.1 cobalamin biosynthesis protein CobD [Fulvivirga kasyanovii]